MPDSSCCCQCLGFILTLGFAAFFLWLSLWPYKPTCSIKNFYLPALNRSLNTPANATIFMDLRLSNGNKEKGIHYDQINMTILSFSDTNRSLWQGKIPGFYQGYQKKATKSVAVATSGVNWTDLATRNQSVVFQVHLQTRVRYKIVFWKTKRHKLAARANVTVNELGAKNTTHGIKLRSGVGKIGINSGKVGTFIGLLAFGLLSF